MSIFSLSLCGEPGGELMKSIHVFAMLLAWAAPSRAHSENRFGAEMLWAHNVERQSFNAPPMIWDSRLASDAEGYAAELAGTGQWRHSTPGRRAGQGENLWVGTRGAFSLADMIASWSSEKRNFRPGVFPNVSRNGSWHGVGHYTQIVWPTTTRVGCGLRSSADRDYLVCRYSSPGNIIGDRIGDPQVAARWHN